MEPFGIVCAWKDFGCPHRLRAYDFTRSYWQHHFPEAELVVACPEPFTNARGLNAAIKAASYDVIVHADPDSIIGVRQLREAVALVRESDGLVVPYERYLYLNEAATAHLHGADLDDPLPNFGPADCEFFGAGGAGPVTAFSRRTWEAARGYDERFGMWGGEDAAFSYACSAFVRPERRISGAVLHSFHPRLPESQPGHPGYVEQFTLVAEYRDAAAAGPEAVRDLVKRRSPLRW